MAEKIESRASAQLLHDPLGLCVDAFGAAVVLEQVRAASTADRSISRPLVRLRRCGDSACRPEPLGEFHVVASGRFQRAAKPRTRLASAVISGQAAAIFSSKVVSFARRFSGLVSSRRLA
ncbi:hypothetical protein GCM10010178_39830 [Lentzea flava]|uniref:Uncharacterized protein n=1 Tax=Lentzea flava TaxID=103732 RepID=A0ABQ2UPB9_9PSEU|nr:hypothetical protein GCM10010178_39830 [Lentzea flava]